MKVSVAAQGSGSFSSVIGDDSAGDFISGFRPPTMSGQAQVTPLFRSETPFVGARGNRTWQLSGTIEKVHATNDIALAFLEASPDGIPDFVDVKVEQPGGGYILLSKAVFVGFVPAINGRSTTCTYTFVGAVLTSSVPPE